jgi:acetyl-CoA synthetase (ADP-forming)
MKADMLEKFFEPRSLVLVGATRTPGFGYGIPKFLKRRGWLDKTFLVNPKGGEIEGQKVYETIADLPAEIDLAVIIVPAAAVKQAVIELGRKGVKAAIIESAGFAETGEPGRRLQEEVLAAAKEYGMRLLGPNCVGVVNTGNKFATIEVMDPAFAPGKVAIIAQSGVFGNILLDHLPEVGLKISKVATLGNKIDLDEADFLDYFSADEKTRVILVYEEGVKDGRRLLDALKRACEKKWVVILKSGATPLGARATLSHTGSLSGQDAIYDAAFRQAGAVRAHSLEEMIDLAQVLSTQPKMAGKKVGVVTSSGSLGALCSDALFREGLELAEWSGPTLDKVRRLAPGYLNVKNPLDTGPSGIFKDAVETVFADPNPDGFIFIPVVPFAAVSLWKNLGFNALTWLGDWKLFRQKAKNKPAVAVLLGAKEWTEDLKSMVGDEVACVSSPENAAKALARLLR